MEVTFINVGYGDAILIEHNGLWALIDGGSGMPEEFTGNRISLRSYLEKRNISRLACAIITHIHEDHVCGLLECISHVEIGEFYGPYIPAFDSRDDDHFGSDLPANITGYISALNAYRKIFFHAQDHHIPFHNLMEKETIYPLGDEVAFSIVEPSLQQSCAYTKRIEEMLRETDAEQKYILLTELEHDSNDASVFLRIAYQQFSFLLTADNCPTNWREKTFSLLENGNVLKLPHHGQLDAVNDRLLKHLGPDYIVTSSSSDHRHNSSNAMVYEQLRSVKEHIQMLFTDEVSYVPFTDTKRMNLQDLRFLVWENHISVEL
jgi:competence protein ComEC